jgi:hypothetical protein
MRTRSGSAVELGHQARETPRPLPNGLPFNPQGLSTAELGCDSVMYATRGLYGSAAPDDVSRPATEDSR